MFWPLCLWLLFTVGIKCAEDDATRWDSSTGGLAPQLSRQVNVGELPACELCCQAHVCESHSDQELWDQRFSQHQSSLQHGGATDPNTDGYGSALSVLCRAFLAASASNLPTAIQLARAHLSLRPGHYPAQQIIRSVEIRVRAIEALAGTRMVNSFDYGEIIIGVQHPLSFLDLFPLIPPIPEHGRLACCSSAFVVWRGGGRSYIVWVG